jgi:hypothetical protein
MQSEVGTENGQLDMNTMDIVSLVSKQQILKLFEYMLVILISCENFYVHERENMQHFIDGGIRVKSTLECQVYQHFATSRLTIGCDANDPEFRFIASQIPCIDESSMFSPCLMFVGTRDKDWMSTI